MSINDLFEKVKAKIAPFYFVILAIVLAIIFFGLGRLSVLEEKQTPIRILQPESGQTASVISAIVDNSPSGVPAGEVAPVSATSDGSVIGSKSGKKYYFPWCGTVKRMKPESQVHFASIAEARSAGFVAGGNCKGLK